MSGRLHSLDLRVDPVPARFPHGSRMGPTDFHTVSDDFHNSDKQPASVTHFGPHFAHLSDIWDATGTQSVSPAPQKY